MVKRVWEAAMASKADKVVVLWPERNPDIPETDLFTPFSRLIKEFKPKYIIRLTADCPLLTSKDINEAIELFNYMGVEYYNNCRDGYDVQIFTPDFMRQHPHKEHVLAVKYNYNGFSVNTKSDLAMVRQIAR